jgi:hypothetical protein
VPACLRAYVPECVRIMLKKKDHDSNKPDKNHEIFFSGLTVQSGPKNLLSKFADYEIKVLSLWPFGNRAGY